MNFIVMLLLLLVLLLYCRRVSNMALAFVTVFICMTRVSASLFFYAARLQFPKDDLS